MKKFSLAGALLFFAAASASGQVFQVNSNGNIVATGSATANGVISTSGTGAGQLTLSTGSIIQPGALSVNLIAPSNMTSFYQAIFPSTGQNGWWRGTYGSGAAGTVSVNATGNLVTSGGVTITPSGGSGYTVPPACWITATSGSGGTCSVTSAGSGSITAANVSILTAGSGYPISGTATLNFGNQIQMAFADLTGDATTNGSTLVSVVKIQNTPVTGVVGTSGNYVPLTPSTSPASGDVVSYDSSRNIIDSGTQLTSLAPLSGPTFTGATAFGSGATLTLPSSAAYAPTGAGLFGYDSTNNRPVLGNGTNTSYLTWLNATPTANALTALSGTLGQLVSSAEIDNGTFLEVGYAGSASQPSLTFTDTTTGFYRAASNSFGWSSGGTLQLALRPTAVQLASADSVAWGSGSPGLAADTTICRSSAGNVEIGSATGCGATGGLLAGAITSTGVVALSGGLQNSTVVIDDKTAGFLTSAMSAGNSTTCTAITNMSWTTTNSKDYILRCHIPVTFTASATIGFCLANATGSPSYYNLDAHGEIGASSAWADINVIGATAWSTKTSSSPVPGAFTRFIDVEGEVQNSSSSGGTMTLDYFGNGTNNVTIGENGSCTLTQTN